MSDTMNTDHARFINCIPPLLEVLRKKGGSATTKEVRDGIAARMNLSDDDLAERYDKSGQLTFNNQVYWAKQYLAWENLVEVSKRGVWALTDYTERLLWQNTQKKYLS
jgi:restriction system protein